MITNLPALRLLTTLAIGVGGCAGGEMSRFGEADGVFSTGDSSGDEGDASPTTDPTAADDGADGGPTTAATSATDDGADETPATDDGADTADTLATTGNDDTTTGLEESSSGAVSDASAESSSDGGDTSVGDSVDLSGWTVVQTDSAREIVLPAGTVVPLGGTLVIARNASPGAFQAFWGVNWGDLVVYIDGADLFPTINGSETYSLRDTDGNVVEGPTPPLELSTVLARTDAAAPADDAMAWSVDLAPNDGSTPGVSAANGGVSGTPYVSEYTDPIGAGNYIYEYVEIGIVP